MNNDSFEMNPESVDSDSIVDWENPPKLADLKADYQEAQGSHVVHVSDVDGWLSDLRGDQQVNAKKGRSKIVPKLIRKQAEWRYSSLSEPFLSTEDLFNAYPHTFEDKQAAEQNALVLNYQMNYQLNKVKFINDYVRTSVNEGTVVVKLGWESEEGEREVEVPVMATVLATDPATGQQVSQEIQTGSEVITETYFIKNKPTIEVCNYNNVVIDPTCLGNTQKASFIIHSFETSMSNLKKDGRYTNLENIREDSSSVLASPDHEPGDESHFKFKDKPRRKFVVHEYWGYWDIDDTGEVKPIIATWAGDTLIRLEENPFPDKELPFVLVQHLPMKESNYGQPDGYLIEDNQRIVGAVTRGMIDIMGRSANGQQGVRKDALDTVNAIKFEKGADYKFNANVDPKQAFHMGTYPEIPSSAITMLQLQNNEAESMTGVKAFSDGITGSSLGENVGGIRSAMDATAKREFDILLRLSDGIIRIGRKIISMNSEFLGDREIFRITNDEFIAIDRDSLAGNFDVRLEISTAEADNEKARELSFMLQTMGNNMDPALSRIIFTDIAKLRKMPDLAKKISEYQPQPDPLVEEEKALKIELLKAQIFNEQAKGKENTVDVDLKKAKTRTEDAKARNLHSGADKSDLDFVEQESGVDRQHEENMKNLDANSSLDQEAMKQIGANKNDTQTSGVQ